MAEHHTHHVISIQSTGLWPVASGCLERAYPIYLQNPGRPPVAGEENGEASVAVLVLIVSLESHLNRLMFFENAGLTTDEPMLTKVQTYLPEDSHTDLRKHLSEVTVCRDAVTHALIWLETRTFDSHWKLVDQVTELAPITHLRKKVIEHVPAGTFRTEILDLNVVPTNVDFIDAVKTLIVVTRIMRALERKYGNPRAWVGQLPAAIVLQKTFPLTPGDDAPEDWIAAMLSGLHRDHRGDLTKRLGNQSDANR